MPCILCEEPIVPGEIVTLGAPYQIANSVPPQIVARAENDDAAIHVRCQNDYLVDNFECIEREAPEFCWPWKAETSEQLLARTGAILALTARDHSAMAPPPRVDAASRLAIDLS